MGGIASAGVARRILEALNKTPGLETRVNRKLKTNLLLACALAGQNQTAQALQTLHTCLDLAESEGHMRVFLDIGEPMKTLLQLYRATHGPMLRVGRIKIMDQARAAGLI